MRSIYLVMSQTGSILSKAIKFFTKKEYNHISLSFDDKLDCMYSFGRKYTYNPFIGAFVIENIKKGAFLRFSKTKCKVIEVRLTDQQYNKLLLNIENMVVEKKKYKYNILGLFLALFNIERHPDTKFYCSEFVRYVLDRSGVDVSMIPTIPHPVDFEIMSNKEIYKGILKDYSIDESI